jgi:hypothetical protein
MSELVTFRGEVLEVEGDTARLELYDERGRRAYAEYDAKELEAAGVSLGTVFTCEIDGDAQTLRFAPVPWEPLTAAELDALREQVAHGIEGWDERSDY